MISVLYIIGVVVFVISIIMGISSGSFMGFLMVTAGGLSSAMIFFALAKVLENQETILYKLAHQEEAEKRSRVLENNVCSKCKYAYDRERNSCPNCGNRE